MTEDMGVILIAAHVNEGGWRAGGAVDSAWGRQVKLQLRETLCWGLLRQ